MISQPSPAGRNILRRLNRTRRRQGEIQKIKIKSIKSHRTRPSFNILDIIRVNQLCNNNNTGTELGCRRYDIHAVFMYESILNPIGRFHFLSIALCRKSILLLLQLQCRIYLREALNAITRCRFPFGFYRFHIAFRSVFFFALPTFCSLKNLFTDVQHTFLTTFSLPIEMQKNENKKMPIIMVSTLRQHRHWLTVHTRNRSKNHIIWFNIKKPEIFYFVHPSKLSSKIH
jgi:hypothetical protein